MRPLALLGLGVLLAVAMPTCPTALALTLFEKAPVPTLSSARELADRGQYAEAIFTLKEIVEGQPGNAEAYSLLGYCYAKVKDYRHSRRSYESALAIDGNDRRALAALGTYYAETGDTPSAESYLKRLQAACPTGCAERTALQKAIADSGN